MADRKRRLQLLLGLGPDLAICAGGAWQVGKRALAVDEYRSSS